MVEGGRTKRSIQNSQNSQNCTEVGECRKRSRCKKYEMMPWPVIILSLSSVQMHDMEIVRRKKEGRTSNSMICKLEARAIYQ